MPDRCTDPTCEQHWPAPVAEDMTEWADASIAASSIVDDIQRAMDTVKAAQPHRHDCKARGCIR